MTEKRRPGRPRKDKTKTTIHVSIDREIADMDIANRSQLVNDLLRMWVASGRGAESLAGQIEKLNNLTKTFDNG